MEISNEQNKDLIVKWLTDKDKADILPSKASKYADLVIASGIGSISRITKKLMKNGKYLVEIGIDPDDAEEIAHALLKERNRERSETMEKTASFITKSNVTPSISYQAQRPPPPPSSDSDALQLISSVSITPLPAAHESRLGHRRTKTADLSRNLSALSLESNPFARKSTLPVDDLETARPSSARMSYPAVPTAPKGLMRPSTSSGNLQSLGVSFDPKVKGGNETTGRHSETLPITNTLAPASSPNKTHPPHPSAPPPRSASLGPQHDDDLHRRTSVLDPLRKFDPRGAVRPVSGGVGGSGSGGGTNTIYMSREQMEISALCTSLAAEFNTAVQSRTSQSHCNALLTRVMKQAPEDKKLYCDCFVPCTGICRDIALILATYPDSEEICSNCCNVISLLCQYGDKRDTLNHHHIRSFGEAGATTSVLQILTTFRANHSLIEKACRTLAKLSNNEENIATLTTAGACENLLSLLDEVNSGQTLVEILHAVRNLAQRELTVQYLIECGMCEGLTCCLEKHLKEELTTQSILRAMNMIAAATSTTTVVAYPHNTQDNGAAGSTAASAAAAAKKFGEVRACEVVTNCLKSNRTSVLVCEWGLMTICALVVAPQNVTRLLEASICEVIISCLNQNMHAAYIARGASHAIQLLATTPEIRSILGKAGACEAFPRALSNHLNAPTIAQGCCGAIGTLSELHDDNKAKLTTAGACEILISTMQKYSSSDAFMNALPPGSEMVVWQACWALRKLAYGGLNRKRLESSSVCEAMNTVCLKHIAVVDIIVQAFRAIHTLTSNRTHTIVAHMGNAGVCKAVVKAVLKHPTNGIICKLGAEVMCHLGECPENIEKLLSAKAVEAVTAMITSHSSNDEVLTEWACHGMYLFASYNEAAATRIRQIGGIEAIVWALQRQMKHQAVAEWGTNALNEVATYPANRSRVGTAGGCEVAISTAKRHAKVATISQRTCRVINYLAMDSNNRAWLGASGACAVVVKALEEHADDHLACAAACSAVASLACNHEGNNNRLRSVGACERVIMAMKKHLTESAVSLEGCHAVYRLGEFSESIVLLSDANAISQVIECMLVHGDNRGVAKHSFQALYRLSDPRYPFNYSRLMEAKVNSALIKVMKSTIVSDHVDVCIEAARVIQNLACYSDNRLSLGQDGACDTVTAILRQHMMSSDELVLEISNASSQLATDCPENTEKLIDAGLCESCVSSLTQHKHHDGTTAAICRCLVLLTKCHSAQATLTDYDQFRIFVKHLSRIKDDEVAVMWAFQLITALCHDQKSCTIMGKANGCKVVTTALLQYRDARIAVETGMLTLLALSGVNEEPDYENLIRMSSPETCDAISLALRIHGSYRTIADAAFVIIIRLSSVMKAELASHHSDHTEFVVNDKSPTPSPIASKGWKKLKAVLMRSKEALVEKAKPLVSQVQTHLSHGVSTSALIHAFSPEELAAKQQVRAKLGIAGACEGVVESLFANVDSEETTLKACEALYHLSLEEENLEFIVRANGAEVLASVLKMYAGRLESLVVHTTLIIHELVSASLRNKISNPHIGVDFGNYGVCEVIGMTIFLYSEHDHTIEAICKAANLLARSSIANQTAFGNADAGHGLMDILRLHKTNPIVVSRASSTIYSILKRHGENASKFVVIANAEIITSLLRTWITDTEIVANILWILKVLGPMPVSTSSSSSMTGTGKWKNNLFVHSWNEPIHSTILAAFTTHAATDARVCQFGSEAINVILEPIPYQDTFLRSNSDVDFCLYFGNAGLHDLAFSSLSLYITNEEVLEPLLRTCALLTRRHDTFSLPHYRPNGVTKSHNNYKTQVPPVITDIIFRIINKHSAHVGVSRSAMFVLNNLLVDRDLLTTAVNYNLRSILKAMNILLQDPHGVRYACNFMTTLLTCDIIQQERLTSVGGANIPISALQNHLTFPLTVRDSSVAIAMLCKANPAGKERVGTGGGCEALTDAFAAYSLNENIAVELCHATSVLTEQAPQLCLRFASTEIGEHVVSLLQSFGCGETDRSATIAELCCRVIADLSLTPPLPDSKVHWGTILGNLGACETIILVLEKYSTREDVAYQACKALSNLSKSEANLSKLHNAGGVRVLTNTAKQFRTSGKIDSHVKQTLARLKGAQPDFLG
jgi:mannitol/fructose-specific phosphotransferase system IIA component (Ntr-type)